MHNSAAERQILGGCMMYPREVLEISLRPEDFYEPRHEQLFDLILTMARAGQPADPVGLSARVGHIQGVDAGYLHALYGEAPLSGILVHERAREVGFYAQKRRLMGFAGRIAADVPSLSPEQLAAALDSLREDLDAVANTHAAVKVKTFSEQLAESVELWRKPADLNFKPTGWAELDDMLNGGWKPGQVTVLGARPAVGKSAVAACATVAAHEYGVGFFSLEMSAYELMGRMVAIEKGIKLDRITRHDLTAADWEQIGSLQREAQGWKVWLEDRPRRSIAQIRATLRTWSRSGHIPLVVIDYLQLVAPADKNETRERAVSRIAEDCKAIAKDFGCHVLVLAQVNRASTQREGARPTMADLRESGGIEANADNIILLHRDPETPDQIEFNVEKNRHGRTGRVELAWRPDYSSANTMGGDGRFSYPFGLGKK